MYIYYNYSQGCKKLGQEGWHQSENHLYIMQPGWWSSAAMLGLFASLHSAVPSPLFPPYLLLFPWKLRPIHKKEAIARSGSIFHLLCGPQASKGNIWEKHGGLWLGGQRRLARGNKTILFRQAGAAIAGRASPCPLLPLPWDTDRLLIQRGLGMK